MKEGGGRGGGLEMPSGFILMKLKFLRIVIMSLPEVVIESTISVYHAVVTRRQPQLKINVLYNAFLTAYRGLSRCASDIWCGGILGSNSQKDVSCAELWNKSQCNAFQITTFGDILKASVQGASVQILLDGKDIRSLDLRWYRSNVGLVSQVSSYSFSDLYQIHPNWYPQI